MEPVNQPPIVALTTPQAQSLVDYLVSQPYKDVVEHVNAILKAPRYNIATPAPEPAAPVNESESTGQ